MPSQKPCPDWISLIVVGFLGIIALLLSAGIIYLADVGKTPDAAIYTLAGTAIGGLGSLLVNPHRNTATRQTDTPSGSASDPVSISTPAGESLSVTETAPAEDAPAEDDLKRSRDVPGATFEKKDGA